MEVKNKSSKKIFFFFSMQFFPSKANWKYNLARRHRHMWGALPPRGPAGAQLGARAPRRRWGGERRALGAVTWARGLTYFGPIAARGAPRAARSSATAWNRRNGRSTRPAPPRPLRRASPRLASPHGTSAPASRQRLPLLSSKCVFWRGENGKSSGEAA